MGLVFIVLIGVIGVQHFKIERLERSGVLQFEMHNCQLAREEYALCKSRGLTEACIEPKEICYEYKRKNI